MMEAVHSRRFPLRYVGRQVGSGRQMENEAASAEGKEAEDVSLVTVRFPSGLDLGAFQVSVDESLQRWRA